MSFLNRIRLPFYVSRPQFPAEEDIYLKANGRRVVMKSIVSKSMEGKTDYMPAKLHERLTIALRHDEVNIESDDYSGEVKLVGAYDIDWVDFLNYPVAPATFRVFEEAFVARSNRCEACSNTSLMNLQDDYVEEFMEEGATVEINVRANDGICCSSAVFSIEDYDSAVIDSISISQEGVVTLTLKTGLDSMTNKLLFTYGVKCGDTEDTAEVTGNISGSLSDPCPAPSNLNLVLVNPSSNPYEIQATWDASIPAPALDYVWELYEWDGVTDTLVTNGTTSGTSVNINSLECDKYYRFKLRAKCGEDSESATLISLLSVPCADAGHDMYLVNETGNTVDIGSEGVPYSFPAFTNGDVEIFPNGVFQNVSGITLKFRFLQAMPAVLIEEVTLVDTGTHVFPADVSLYNYVRVTIP